MDRNGTGARVLVVDDDASARESTCEMLSVSGYEVQSAINGAVGLEAVLTFRPEVVVFDFWMPVSDGRELLLGIREVARERMGLVAMSGTPEVEDWCTRVGVAQFVRKPFEKQVLVEAVGRALDDARASSQRSLPSLRPSQRRLLATRAVLLVGEHEVVRAVRSRLREGEQPMQVAVVPELEDAHRALGSFMLDAVAICGRTGEDRSTLSQLAADAAARGLPLVVDAANEVDVPPSARVSFVRDANPDALVVAITAAATTRS
jgi:CheY-like chemotaxis protein